MKTVNATSNYSPPITLGQLLEILSKLPNPPAIYGIDFKQTMSIVPNQLLPDNTVFVSMDLAEKLEKIDFLKTKNI